MSLAINKQEDIVYKKVSEGTHVAIPVQIIDFGHQFKTEWPSMEKVVNEKTGDFVLNQQVFIQFEFPTQTDTFNGEEKPLWLGKTFTLSVKDDGTSYVHKKSAMMQLILSANPDADSLSDLIGKPVNVSVGLTESGNPKITAVVEAPEDLVINKQVVEKDDLKLFNEPVIYSMSDGKNEVYDGLPDWMKEKIDNQADDLKPKF